MKHLLTLTLCLLLGGCSQKMYSHEKWDPQQNLIEKTAIKLNGVGTEHEAKVIFVHTDSNTKTLFVGDYKQLLNPAVIKAAFQGATDALLRWLFPLGIEIGGEGE